MAVHFCFIDSGHACVDGYQVMHYLLMRQVATEVLKLICTDPERRGHRRADGGFVRPKRAQAVIKQELRSGEKPMWQMKREA